MKPISSLTLLLALGLALGACQSTVEPVPAEDTPLPVPTPVAEPEPIVYGNFTVDQLNRAILNEMGGQRGYLPEAAQDYYAMALETEDLGVIRRASQFASAMGDTQAMVELGRLWIAKAPDAIEPHMVLSFQLLENGMPEEAIEHMRRVVELGGEVDFTTLAPRTGNLAPEQRAGIIAGLRDLRVSYPAQRSLHYAIIQLLEQSELPGPAMEELLAYRESYGNSARLMLLEAQLHLQSGRQPEALQILAAGVEAYPDNRLMRFNFARVLVQSEDLVNAREQFAVLAEMDPNDQETLYSLALLDLELGDISNARRLFTQLSRANYRPHDSHFYLGMIAENEGNLQSAIANYQQVGMDSNNFLTAQRQTIRLLVQVGSVEEARQWTLAVSEGNPRLRLLLTSVEADALLGSDHLDAAEALLTQTLAEHPQDIDLLFTRTLLSERKGDMVRAEEDLRLIIALQPDNARALNHLGYALMERTTRYEEALALVERAIAIEPEDPAIIDSLGWVQFKLGLNEEALANLQRAYAAFPDHEVAAHLGEVLWVLGRQDEANSIWEEALRQHPDSNLLPPVMERLRSAAGS